ncbi:response regulator transcription factor [Candidatus Woesearchaeota archaeon]|nr:response regulator transcription factor [Candidatus Woesearchaeota archaeon]
MERVIIADDHEIVRNALVRLINDRYTEEVETVDDGEPLVEKVREGNYSVVITDERMKEMSGLDAIFEIRKFNTEVPIIMVSNSDIAGVAMSSGATEYLEKIHAVGNPDLLYACLDNYMKQKV